MAFRLDKNITFLTKEYINFAEICRLFAKIHLSLDAFNGKAKCVE